MGTHTVTPGRHRNRDGAAPMSAPCPPFERARRLALRWTVTHEPHPELREWVRVCMMDRWCGAPIGSTLTTGIEMAYHVGAQLGILLLVSPVGYGGVIPLCEAAGWPRPDGSPLT